MLLPIHAFFVRAVDKCFALADVAVSICGPHGMRLMRNNRRTFGVPSLSKGFLDLHQ
jgi:hypothetical protein